MKWFSIFSRFSTKENAHFVAPATYQKRSTRLFRTQTNANFVAPTIYQKQSRRMWDVGLGSRETQAGAGVRGVSAPWPKFVVREARCSAIGEA